MAQYDIGTGLKLGWETFVRRIKDFLVVAAIFGVVAGVLMGVVLLLFSGAEASIDESGSVSGGFLVGGIVLGLVTAVVVAILSLFVDLYNTKLALGSFDQEDKSLGDLAKEANKRFGAWLGWGILKWLLIMVGLVLCILPGIIAAFFLAFVSFVVVDNRTRENPLKASFDAVKDNWLNVLVVIIIVNIGTFVAQLIGSILGFVPFLGPIIQYFITFLIAAAGLCFLVPVFRSTAVGGGVAVGTTAGPGGYVPPYPGAGAPGYQPPAPGGGYEPPAPGGYPQQQPPAPGGYPQQQPPAPGGYPQQQPPAPGGYPQQQPPAQQPPAPPAPGGYPQPQPPQQPPQQPGGGYQPPPPPPPQYPQQ